MGFIADDKVIQLRQSAENYGRGEIASVVQLSLPTKEGMGLLLLEPHDLRSQTFTATLSTEVGSQPDPIYVDLFKGTIQIGESRDFARFALVRDPASESIEIVGYFRAGGKYYSAISAPDHPQTLQIELLEPARLQSFLLRCGVSPEQVLWNNERSSLSTDDAQYFSTSLREAEIASEADYELTRALPNVNAKILAIINAIDAIYQEQVGITFVVTRQNAWTTVNDPYTASEASVLLEEFQDYWESNVSADYDFAHLWTGRDLNDYVVGVAYVGSVCTSYAYGLSQYLGSNSLDVPLAAHEIGHNFGAGHDNCGSNDSYIMCPVLVSNADTFSAESRSSIAAYSNSVSCLSIVDDDSPEEPEDPPDAPTSPPILSPIGSKTVNEGQSLSFTVSASDPDGGDLDYSASGLPSGATFSGQQFSYTPAAGTVPYGQRSLTYSVQFSVSDETGLSDSETVALTVTRSNSAPDLAIPSALEVFEGDFASYQLSASDADGDLLVFSAPGGLPRGATIDASTGYFSWRPGGDQSGVYEIAVSVSDSSGGSDSGILSVSVADRRGVSPLPQRHVLGDFNGDGRAETAVFRPLDGIWYRQGRTETTYSSEQLGRSGDVPVPADYNGDGITDVAVFRPSANQWILRYSRSGTCSAVDFGVEGDVPVPADYDGDGRDDLAVFRPALGVFLWRSSSVPNLDSVITLGAAGDIPVSCDYDGDGAVDPAVFRPTDGTWTANIGGEASEAVFGEQGDIPVPADYDGEAGCERAVWRPADGTWHLAGESQGIQFGLGGDVPTPADYDGDGRADIAVWRPQTALWYFKEEEGHETLQLGLPTDSVALRELSYYAFRTSHASGPAARSLDHDTIALYRAGSDLLFFLGMQTSTYISLRAPSGSYIVRGDYDGDSFDDAAVFADGSWNFSYFGGQTASLTWGVAGDLPVVGDFDGDGRSDVAVYRPRAEGDYSRWYVVRSSDGGLQTFDWGLSGDIPIAADFNGDGWSDPAVWRPANGWWFVLDSRSGFLLEVSQWGLPGDLVRVGDFDGDGRADKAVWRPSEGTWYVRHSGGGTSLIQWGLAGDIPVPGEYVEAGELDYAVYRLSDRTLYVRRSDGTVLTRATGMYSSDTLSAYQPYSPVP